MSSDLNTNKSINWVQEIGPILAGFQLATAFVGFFGIGAFASWVLVRWRPFTHWVWDNFFGWLQLPAITEPEKDALTAVVFFLPMAFWSLIRRFYFEAEDIVTLFTVLAATIASLGFVFLVGGSLIQDTFSSAYGVISQDSITEMPKLLPIYLLAFTLFFVGAAITTVVLFMRKRNRDYLSLRSAMETARQADKDDWAPYEIVDQLRQSLFRYDVYQHRFVVSGLLLTLPVLMAASAAPEVGLIRSISFVGVLLCLVLTLQFDPRRILVTTGAFSAFILSSAFYETAIWISDLMGQVS